MTRRVPVALGDRSYDVVIENSYDALTEYLRGRRKVALVTQAGQCTIRAEPLAALALDTDEQAAAEGGGETHQDLLVNVHQGDSMPRGSGYGNAYLPSLA